MGWSAFDKQEPDTLFVEKRVHSMYPGITNLAHHKKQMKK